MGKNKPILGVIGGLGPIATAHFIALTVQMTDAPKDQDNLDMIIYNFPSIPDRTGYILGSNLKSPLPGLLSVGSALSHQGARYIAIPCITAHYFYPELTAALNVPVINAVDETVLRLKEAGITAAGIMATDGTVSSGLFSDALRLAGIRPILPSPERQADVTHLIYENIKAGKAPDMERFQSVSRQLRKNGAEVIILGCTELSLIKRDYPLGPGYLDAMEVLAQQSVILSGGRLKSEYRSLITI